MPQPEPLQQRSLRPNFAGGVILSPLLKANAIFDPYSKVCRTTYPVKGCRCCTVAQPLVSRSPSAHHQARARPQDLSVSAARHAITRPNQVWAMGITYIPMERGFAYLAVVLDWGSKSYLREDLSTLSTEPASCLASLSCFDGEGCVALTGSDAGKLSFNPF